MSEVGGVGRFSEAGWVRAATSLGANLVRGAISFVTALVVARSLGATGYGNYAFLLGTFAALALLLDCGTTFAFYTMLATRPRGRRFLVVYAAWTVGVQFLATFLAIAVVLPPGAIQKIWIGFDRGTVLLSLASSFVVTQLWTAVTQVAEAFRKTVFIQIISTLQVALHLALVAAAIWMGRLSLWFLLTLPIIEYVLLAIVLLPSLLRVSLQRDKAHGEEESWRSVVGEYWRYCRPLVAYSAVGFAFQFADRWLLQRYGGGVQQGFFSIGQQFANVANLVTVSILAVIWKEVAEAFGRNDLVRVRQVFVRARLAVFFCGAAVSAMLLPYVGLLLRSTVGDQYAGATLCVSLMFLYPIHQAVSQLQQTVLLATGATSAYSSIGIAMMLISIPISYFVLASPSARPAGFGLGALGLAFKFVLLQTAGVMAQFSFLRRRYGFEHQIAYDLTVLLALFGASWAIKMLVEALAQVVGLADHAVALAVAGAAVYISAVAWALVRRPSLAGVTPEQRAAAIHAMRLLVGQKAA